MAEYLGKITLVNVTDGTPGTPGVAGPGIQSSMVYYAISKTNSAPPALVEVTLKSESGIISFSDISSTFQIKEGILYGVQNGALTPLSINNKTDGNILTGMEGGWDTVIPVAPAGWYIWTKTVFTYTNGDQTITYTVAQNGADGKTLYTWFKYADDDQGTNMSDSPEDKKYMGIAYNKETEQESNNPADYVWSLIQGADGQGADAYHLITNQEEILRFITLEQDENGENKITISPETLEIQINKRGLDGSITAVNGLAVENLKLSTYQNGLWTTFDYEPVLDASTQRISISFADTVPTEENKETRHFLKLVSETVLKIEYQYKDYALTKHINVRYGMTKDQATLNIYSNGILQSIQNTKLKFDATGLTIQNGGVKVLNNSGAEVLKADDNGNLELTGTIYADSGRFTGEVNATSGSFSGEIKAATGSIGGFTIESDRLISADKTIILNGKEGGIIAKKIILGTSAEIEDYIKLGSNVILSKPSENNENSFLIVKSEGQNAIDFKADGSLNITGNGKIKVGDSDNYILVDGANALIQSENYNTGTGWSISNKEAIFNNVSVRGSIKASVLEYGEAQSVGGILLVRPSSRIVDAEGAKDNMILTLENSAGFNINDVCLITLESDSSFTKIYGTIVSLNDKKISVQFLNNDYSSKNFIGQPIISFGYVSEEGIGQNNIGIGINGSTDDTLVSSQSISVFEMNEGKELIPRIILGKLPAGEQYGFAAGSYGLYAENALLKGSLVTEARIEGSEQQENVYCGISTSKTIGSPKSYKLADLLGIEPSEILFWAGAKDDSAMEIENSAFFVDRRGNFYSNSGYFQGSIITEAIIQASEIQTATLTGIGEKPALTIKDAVTGIKFQNGEKDIFVLEGNKVNIKATLEVFDNSSRSKFTVNENGNTIMSKAFIDNYEGKTLMLSDRKIELLEDFNRTELAGAIKSFIEFDNDQIKFSPNGTEMSMVIGSEKTKVANNLQLGSSSAVKYGDKISYQPVVENDAVIGYDLYVFD